MSNRLSHSLVLVALVTTLALAGCETPVVTPKPTATEAKAAVDAVFPTFGVIAGAVASQTSSWVKVDTYDYTYTAPGIQADIHYDVSLGFTSISYEMDLKDYQVGASKFTGSVNYSFGLLSSLSTGTSSGHVQYQVDFRSTAKPEAEITGSFTAYFDTANPDTVTYEGSFVYTTEGGTVYNQAYSREDTL